MESNPTVELSSASPLTIFLNVAINGSLRPDLVTIYNVLTIAPGMMHSIYAIISPINSAIHDSYTASTCIISIMSLLMMAFCFTQLSNGV